MSRDEAAIEAEIKDKGLTAPRLTPALIDEQIHSAHFMRGTEALAQNGVEGEFNNDPHLIEQSLGCLTICVLVLKNGFTVVGKSACASPENFNWELGCRIARENAREQIWALEGYALRKKLVAQAESQRREDEFQRRIGEMED